MAEAAVGEMVVADFDDQLGPERLPFVGAPRAPAARTAWGVAGEARRLDQRLDEVGDFRAARPREARREADVIEQPFVVVQAQQQRADRPCGRSA